jgi:hypothetical protein
MKSLLRDYIRALGWYVALIVVGLVATLTISSAVGYLPYSDRPGPSWTRPSLSFGQLGYYASWSVFLLFPASIYGTGAFAYHRLLRFLNAPLLLIRMLAGLTGGIISFVIAAGAGWYIAMASFPVWVAAGLGGLWGGLLLPRFLGPAGPVRRPWIKWSAVGLIIVAGPLTLYQAFFAPSYGQSLQWSIVRVTANTGHPPRAGWKPDLDPGERALLDSLFPNGLVEPGVSGSSATGAADHTARMLVVVTAPVNTEVRLRVPRGVSVVYVQQGNSWAMFPLDAPTLKDRIRLAPGSKPTEIRFAWPGADLSTIEWDRE